MDDLGSERNDTIKLKVISLAKLDTRNIKQTSKLYIMSTISRLFRVYLTQFILLWLKSQKFYAHLLLK